ncbi:MAG: GntR family transcriptional regulator [Pirellulales bacterium]|nr:GntR family transcriptional regulator [Pirellulales bacterium]
MNESLTDKAYHHIHAGLITGQLVPGMRLSNRAVAKEVGVSFTPVREALNRLVSEGLLEYRHGVGVFVPEVSRREIDEIFELRETLECAALAKVCGRLSRETLAEVAGCLETMRRVADRMRPGSSTTDDARRGEEFRVADAAFHAAILRAAGNRVVMEIVGSLGIFSTMIWHRLDGGPSTDMARTIAEHERIVALLDEGNAKEAKEIMTRHLRVGHQRTLAAYDQRYMSGVKGAPHGPHKPATHRWRLERPSSPGESL